MRLIRRASLARRTSLEVGGRCRILAEPESPEELRRLLAWRSRRGIPLFVLGGGTNTLVGDAGFAGLVVATGRLAGIRAFPGCRLAVLAGTPLRRVIGATLRRGWSGLENLVGIPGTIGGAVWGNAGGGGYTVGDRVESVLLSSPEGELRRLSGGALPWGYRYSGIGDRIVVEVVLRLRRGDREALARHAREVFARKRATQPLSAASAGCVFRNPPGDSAGRLIEAAGLKGERRGGALFSPRHANFIVNTGGARAADVAELMEEARSRVRKLFGRDLRREVVLVEEGGP